MLSKYKIIICFCYLMILMFHHILEIKLSCTVQDKKDNAFDFTV